jgi:hypothetical protein
MYFEKEPLTLIYKSSNGSLNIGEFYFCFSRNPILPYVGVKHTGEFIGREFVFWKSRVRTTLQVVTTRPTANINRERGTNVAGTPSPRV